MRNSCPNCSSSQTIELSQLDAAHSCNGACLAAAQELLQLDAVASLRPPARRRISIRVLVFFLSAVFLAWPIDLLLAHHFIATHPQATSAEFNGLPVLEEVHPATSVASPSSADIIAAVPDLGTILLLLGCTLAVVITLALDLHQARRFNQTVWAPAFELWSRSHFCVDCMSPFTQQETWMEPEPAEALPAAPASPSAA